MRRTVIFLLAALSFLLSCKRNTYIQISGFAQGGTYTVKCAVSGNAYAAGEELKQGIDSILAVIDRSVSGYNPGSLLSRQNEGRMTADDGSPEFTVLRELTAYCDSMYTTTDGVLDTRAARLFDIWGFGFKNSDNVNQQMIDSILPFVGYQGVCLDVEGHLHKNDPRTILDASSIAKGYMCDIVAEFLKSKGVNDFMIEIGGELAIGGKNAQGKIWSVGINQPVNDSLQVGQPELRDIMHISDCGVATSGNYRNFYVKDGIAYVNFSKEVSKKTMGSYEATMFIGSIVNSLTELPEIKAVQILIEGKKKVMYCGVLDIEEPLARNESLLKKSAGN